MVAKVLRQHFLSQQSDVFYCKTFAIVTPGNTRCVLRILFHGRDTFRILKVLRTNVDIEQYLSSCSSASQYCFMIKEDWQLFIITILLRLLIVAVNGKLHNCLICLDNRNRIYFVMSIDFISKIYNVFPLVIDKISYCMPKVEVIISEIQKQCPNSLPEITQIFESDPDRVAEALKERGRDFQFYAMLRILQSECLRKLKRQFLKPLLQINVADLSNLQFKNEARLKICEGIIESQDLYRTNTIDRHLSDMTDFQRMSNTHRARIEIVNAGNNFLKGDYIKASAQCLAAARMQAFVKNEQHKIQLINKAIAFIFVADIGPEEHKVVCSLCLNDTAKKSKLYGLVTKMYRQDIINAEQVKAVQQLLPKVLKVRDNEGISRINQATFSRNMIPIVNSFTSIKFNTLLNLIGLGNITQLLILLEKTYQNGEISIDQLNEVIYIAGNLSTSEMVKDFLTQIDNVLQQ